MQILSHPECMYDLNARRPTHRIIILEVLNYYYRDYYSADR